MGIARNVTYEPANQGMVWHPPIPVASFNLSMDSGRVFLTFSKLLFNDASKSKTSPAQSRHESGGSMGDISLLISIAEIKTLKSNLCLPYIDITQS